MEKNIELKYKLNELEKQKQENDNNIKTLENENKQLRQKNENLNGAIKILETRKTAIEQVKESLNSYIKVHKITKKFSIVIGLIIFCLTYFLNNNSFLASLISSVILSCTANFTSHLLFPVGEKRKILEINKIEDLEDEIAERKNQISKNKNKYNSNSIKIENLSLEQDSLNQEIKELLIELSKYEDIRIGVINKLVEDYPKVFLDLFYEKSNKVELEKTKKIGAKKKD